MIFNHIIKKTVLSISIFLFIITYSNSYSQTGSIKGKVLDSKTKDALFGANIIIKGTSLGSASDLEGNYVIRNISVGEQTLEISYIGYTPKSVEINVTENRTINLDVELDYKILEGEVVIVTGQVEGQIQAINQQLSSNTISNVVSKSRIEELPDVNAAESIGRLPGVSISRSGGEANKVSIRGLSPKYNTVTVNGVRLPSKSNISDSLRIMPIKGRHATISLPKDKSISISSNVRASSLWLKHICASSTVKSVVLNTIFLSQLSRIIIFALSEWVLRMYSVIKYDLIVSTLEISPLSFRLLINSWSSGLAE